MGRSRANEQATGGVSVSAPFSRSQHMNEIAVSRYITDTFAGVDVVVASGDSYFFYNPDPNALDHRFPFATLVTGDRHDTFSNLDRPDVFRLNIGVSKQTYQSLFGSQPAGEENAYD